MKRLLLSLAVITTACALQAQPWDTKGNVGTIDGTDFIGTTDAVPLNFRLKNLRAARIDTANVGIVNLGMIL